MFFCASGLCTNAIVGLKDGKLQRVISRNRVKEGCLHLQRVPDVELLRQKDAQQGTREASKGLQHCR